MQPWNDWYHCMCNTYGTWLRGDPRGWRTRHHREHIDGDYRNPPDKEHYEALLLRSKRLLQRDPVHLTPTQRNLAIDSIVQSFKYYNIELIAASLDDHHLHLLARFPDHNPRKWMGVAKKNASRKLSESGLAATGGIWGKRSLCEPICERKHQVSTYHYICKHADQGAVIWNYTMGSQKDASH